MTRSRILAWGVAGCLSWALVGCVSVDGPGKSATSQGPLRGTAIPSTFSFATSRGVDLTLSADKTLFGVRNVAGVEVADKSGATLYRGSMHAGQPLAVRLAVAAKDDTIKVTFRTRGVEKTGSVAIANNVATHSFH